MSTCTFLGHRECYDLDVETLWNAIENLINKGVDTFYVGNQGQFDAIVRSTLRQLRSRHPHIFYAVVLAYLPVEHVKHEDFSDTMFPEEIETGPPKFAIARRNRWMIDKSEYCICNIRHTWGGAYKFAQMAIRKGKMVINLSEALPDLTSDQSQNSG